MELGVTLGQGVCRRWTSAVWVASWAVKSCCWAVAAWSSLAGLLLLGLELGEGVGTCVELGLERLLALLSRFLLLFHRGDLRLSLRQGVLQALDLERSGWRVGL